MTSSISFIYVLKPIKEGEAQIGSASITIDGKSYQTQPIKIKITPPAGRQSQTPQRGTARRTPQTYFPFGGLWDDFEEFFNAPVFKSFTYPNIEEPILAQTTISKNTAYVNEMLILTFTFYRAVDLYSQPTYSPPETTGFWSINLPSSKEPRQVTIKGVRYLAQDFKTALFPTTAGKLTIGPATITAQINPFSQPITIKTKPLAINVLPLPEEGKPSYFTGAVGKFSMSSVCNTRKIERGQPFTINVKIVGEGNIQSVTQPYLNINNQDAFKILNTTSKENIVSGFDSVSGSKNFEIIIMPLKEGNYKIGPIKFAFFNPSTKKYVELTSPEFEIEILPSKTPIPKEMLSSGESQPNQNLTDRTLKITFDWRNFFRKIFNALTQPIALYLLTTLVIIFIGTYAIKKYNQRLKSDPLKWRQKQALKVARKRLKKAEGFLKAEKMKEFTTEIYEAVAKYLGDKFSFSSSGITTDKLKEILLEKGISGTIYKQIEDFTAECDFYRFTPAQLSQEKARELFNIASELLITMESSQVKSNGR